MLLVGPRRDRRVLSLTLGDALTVGQPPPAASAATIQQKYAPTKPTNSRTPTN